ncbi:hypothetical protein [Salibacterium halotolerans]|uniref:Uncharacterized protein n=1 Tax=Salibacterium halotolerans TaxID=1884432 RepID=A0A1I5N8C5_9BACI|nr:hypothetical protein [Salibacterium halotolerans]SFP17950.1 hypothetical protein SAMN05518683_10333 [Salibacterium halotolerans]
MTIFERIEHLRKQGVIIEVTARNQVENGNGKLVEEGHMPLITYTCSAMDKHFYDEIFAISADSFDEALVYVVGKVEENMKVALRKVEESNKFA